ncbi:MAG: DUF1963 domain-containing protein [Saprospiraceae bacterium]|nr:DUF1963 domain-containing protein [Saprospiraceae bacterium]
MNFYQLYTDLDLVRTDGEHWSIQSLSDLGGLDYEHHKGNKIPRQADIDKLKVKVWADCPLADVVSKNYYDCFFISNRLRQLMEGLRLPDDHVFFFKTAVTWRGKQHPYHWLQTIEPSNPDDWIDFAVSNFKFESEKKTVQLNSLKELQSRIYDEKYEKSPELGLGIEWLNSEVYFNAVFADLDLFRLPGKGLGRGLFASQRLKDLAEAQGIKGLGFFDSPYVKVSPNRKPPKPTKPPGTFGLQFYDFDRFAGNDNEPKAPVYQNTEAWLQHLFEVSQSSTEQRMSVLNLAKNATRPAIAVERKGSLNPATIAQKPDTSRYFGRPQVPTNFEWPRTEGGQALVFVAQINLQSLPTNAELPSEGLLLFFLDVYRSTDGWPTEPDRYRVFFYEKTEGFILADFPDDLPINADFEAYALAFSTRLDLPDDRWPELFTDAEMPEKEAYTQFIGNLDSEELAPTPKLLGWPNCWQDHVGVELAIWRDFGGNWDSYDANEAKIKESAKEWRLLFEAEADHLGLEDQLTDPKFFFMIHQDDLKKRDFSKTALAVQST